MYAMNMDMYPTVNTIYSIYGSFSVSVAVSDVMSTPTSTICMLYTAHMTKYVHMDISINPRSA
jgi:hypothetical protein